MAEDLPENVVINEDIEMGDPDQGSGAHLENPTRFVRMDISAQRKTQHSRDDGFDNSWNDSLSIRLWIPGKPLTGQQAILCLLSRGPESMAGMRVPCRIVERKGRWPAP